MTWPSISRFEDVVGDVTRLIRAAGELEHALQELQKRIAVLEEVLQKAAEKLEEVEARQNDIADECGVMLGLNL